jgi:hypothetical protein
MKITNNESYRSIFMQQKKQIKANNNRMIAVRIKPIIFKKTTCLVLFFRRK